MSLNIVRRGIVIGTAAGALAFAGTASALTLRGVVVQHNKRAHSIVLALKDGRLAAIHTHNHVAVGRRVVISVRRLRNGTFAANGLRIQHGATQRVRIHGVVTFVNRRKGMFTVSARGASVLVRARRATGASASESLPSVGEDVSVQVGINDQGDLQDQGVQDNGTQTQNIDLEGTILAVDTTNNTLTISADGEDQSGQSITVDVPSTIDITQFSAGQEVELTVSLQSDGTYLLMGSSEDGNSQQANSPGDQQGCEGDQQGDSCSSGTFDLGGTILAVDTTNNTLTVSTDDGDQSGQSVTVDVPSTIDISQFSAGQDVELTVTPQSDGTYLLVSSDSSSGSDGSGSSGSDGSGSSGSDGSGGSGSDGSGSGGGD